MSRLILLAALILGAILALRAAYRVGTRMITMAQTPEDGGGLMPPIVQKCAYVALLIIMFGAASGSLEGF